MSLSSLPQLSPHVSCEVHFAAPTTTSLSRLSSVFRASPVWLSVGAGKHQHLTPKLPPFLHFPPNLQAYHLTAEHGIMGFLNNPLPASMRSKYYAP